MTDFHLPESLAVAPRWFSIRDAKEVFLRNWTRLAKEAFLGQLHVVFETYPQLQSLTLAVEVGINDEDDRTRTYRLDIDHWTWAVENEADLMTPVEAALREAFSPELTEFVVAQPFTRSGAKDQLDTIRGTVMNRILPNTRMAA